jgi:hypothetical protein
VEEEEAVAVGDVRVEVPGVLVAVVAQIHYRNHLREVAELSYVPELDLEDTWFVSYCSPRSRFSGETGVDSHRCYSHQQELVSFLCGEVRVLFHALQMVEEQADISALEEASAHFHLLH